MEGDATKSLHALLLFSFFVTVLGRLGRNHGLLPEEKMAIVDYKKREILQ